MAVQTVRIQEGAGPLVTPLPFSDAEYQRRLDGVRQQMAERGLDAFVSFTPENLYYLSAHDTPGYYFYQALVVTPERGPINVLRRIETTNTLGRGWTREEILRDFPYLTAADITACLEYAADRERHLLAS